MKPKRTIFILLAVIMLTSLVVGSVLAEDGLIFRRNVSKTPEGETEKAAIYMMDFYVPAQASTGLVGPVDNYILDDDTSSVAYEARDYAKPLVSVYIDDRAHEIAIPEGVSSIMGGITFGHFDAFAGISLDDGTSWKTTNLSRSADLSSFTLDNGQAYPGDVHNVVHQVAGDRIFVAWASKYCEGGTPLYSLDPVEDAAYFEDLESTYGKNAVYLYDLFGVSGRQLSVNYTDQGFPEVGEIPYSCVWTARGKLIAGDDPDTSEVEATYVMWTKPERLTSGARDVNLPAVDCAKDAGCILTWQEDPEGLRPGQGLGPGEGWSGAVANGKTDIWYSYISYADFDKVFADEDTIGAITINEYAADTENTSMPKPYVPMAMPTRLTDNNMCKASNSDPYCYIDFDNIDAIDPLALPTAPTADSDFCAEQISWTTPGGSTLSICKTEDGRVLNGRVASTRVRLNLKPYTPADAVDLDGDGLVEKSAWVIMAAEETKALGDMLIDPYGNPAEDPIDIGKDVWYYSFDMFEHPIIDQGGMINQPASCSPWTVGASVDCEDYELFPVQLDPLNGGDFYLTEIARRFALTTNSVQAAIDSDSGLAAMLIYKQGIINQGGPADIFLRRVVYEPLYEAVEDIDGDGKLDIAEDLDGDGNLDVAEDLDGDGNLDVAEDLDGDGNLDVAEDLDADGNLDVAEDLDGDGELDEGEDVDGDGKLDLVAEDLDADGNLDVAEDVDGDGNLDVAEDMDGDNTLDLVAEDLDGDGILDVDEDVDGDGVLDNGELIIENPYAFENMECAEWLYTDGTNPNYLKGLCLSPAINISANTIVECSGASGNDACADTFPVADDGSIPDSDGSFPKVLEWRQCDGAAALDGCEVDNDLDDQSWENPFDVSKGHRGFLDGDYVMMMYAWSPNWKANSVGNDHYNLYVRRSFDGGLTWTTTPADLGGVGTTSIENYCVNVASADCVATEFTYAAGDFEQGRNVSQLVGNKVTILDPRYSPTGGMKLYPTIRTDWLTTNGFSFEGLPYEDDAVRDPSKFFMVYETGDNTTVAEGEAVPLDLFYSRGTVYGDVWELDPDWYDPETGEIEDYRWPWLENATDDLSGEASMLANPGGTFMYTVWNQWKEEITDDGHELVFDSDMIFRRLMYVADTDDTDYVPTVWLIEIPEPIFDVNSELVLVGAARDFDKLGAAEIAEYEWTMDGEVVSSDRYFKAPPRTLSNGWHGFGFRAKDHEGHWSKAVTYDVFVAETVYKVRMPSLLLNK